MDVISASGRYTVVGAIKSLHFAFYKVYITIWKPILELFYN